MGKGGSGSAAPPDPAKTAASEAAANRLTTFRPDGSLAQQFGYIDRGTGQFVGGAPPEAELPQAAVRVNENDFERGIRQTAEGAATTAAGAIAQNANTLGAAPVYDPNAGSIAQTIYDRSANLMRRDVEQGRQRLETSLQARGLAPGSSAYNRAMQTALEAENQQFATLGLDAQLAAQGEARSDYATQESGRANRLNELAGLLGGGYAPGAVQTPSGAAPLDVSSQYWQQYNAQQQAAQSRAQSSASGIGALGSIAGGLIAKSSRMFKQDIRPISAAAAIRVVCDTPINLWRYRPEHAEGDTTLHAGPMAEAFHRRTGLGTGTHIHVLDAVGVLWRAVQALEARVRELEGGHDLSAAA